MDTERIVSQARRQSHKKYCINKLLDRVISSEATRLEDWHRNLELHVTNNCLPQLDPSRGPQMIQVKPDG